MRQMSGGGISDIVKGLVVGLRMVLPHAFRGTSPITVPKLHSFTLLDERSYSVLSVGHHSFCRNGDHRRSKKARAGSTKI